MSTASTHPHAPNPGTPGHGDTRGTNAVPAKAVRIGLLDRVLQPMFLAQVVLLVAAVVLLFWTWFVTQNSYSMSSGDWSHAYFVPLISLYILWQQREAVERTPIEVFWPGLIPLLMAIWSYIYFLVGVPNHLGQGLSLTLCVFGAALLLLGPGMMRYLFFPISYLLFSITVPEKIMNHITWPLQNFAAQGAYVGLKIVGVHVDISGNQLNVFDPDTLRDIPLNVAQACSGMRMLIAFLALGAAVALVSVRSWWKRVVLLALAPPLALLLNVIRIIVLGVASLWDPNLAAGQAHTFIGTILLIPGFFVYLLVVVAINKAVPEERSANGTVAAGGAE